MKQSSRASLKRVAFIGTYLPRQCGIATFTSDLRGAVAAEFPQINCFAVPVTDAEASYDYPPEVRFEIMEQDPASYRQTADFLNVNNVDLVCLQHEYGIFGGPAGSYILRLLRELRIPVVTTLHTVLKDPDFNQREVISELARLSNRMVVMSEHGLDFLKKIYRVPSSKIDLIPHGIPDVPFVDPNFYKDKFGVEGKNVLLTFGLLSANKGIEYVIEALPEIVRQHPNTVYLVLGATHPNVVRHEGESYRESLQQLARDKGVSEHVIFHDWFVTLGELIEYIGAADIYLTPYLNPAQITSGTLAYTVGAGKAVISTPYWYAQDLLADGRGISVPFHDADAIAQQVNYLLDNDAERHAMRKRAYLQGREMIWSEVARRYVESFERAREEWTASPRIYVVRKDDRPVGLPPLKLDHLKHMTDDTGLLQHATYTVPNYSEGYSTDDNARALLLTTLLEANAPEVAEDVEYLASRYLAFLAHAFNHENGRFRNFLSYDRRWLEEVGSEDSHARSLWSLGTVLGRSKHEGMHGVASQIFELALPSTLDFSSPRAWAFTLLGLHEYLRRYSGDRVAHNVQTILAERLMDLYTRTKGDDWLWYEDVVSYSNAKLPHALLLCGQSMNRLDMIDVGMTSLRWLADAQRAKSGHFSFIGNGGFYHRLQTRAYFDQQPVEAHGMVSACLEAYRITGDMAWYEDAWCALEWFLGHNDLGLSVYDPATGGCRDGLHPTSVNQNQGAESTLAYLLTWAELQPSEHLMSVAQLREQDEPTYRPTLALGH
ncbi:MAG: glycosyltransferase family 4 protein [Anaerolineae bacterium]|nr:glycosyltransferase family 4 protein [Anaerolineae bacterium]